ncbi:DUF3152 domain-containing protein [Aestuariimicrobium soli]|uniref:DUF3152 domain-containing protein n=1 Tax=Aestuariimicrobium soli TaxID=2035834 RepID=UPI003EB7C8C0
MAVHSPWPKVAMAALLVCLSACATATSVGNPPANPTPSWTPPASSAPTTSASAATTAASAAATTSASSATQRSSKAPTPGAPSTGSDGIVRSGTKSTGKFDISTLNLAPVSKGARTVRYVVRVEQGTGIKADEAAREVHAALNDKRGWMGTDIPQSRGVRFELVSDAKRAELTLTIAAPPTVDKLCPLDTKGVWSCEAGETVLINSDRWLHRTPTYTDTAVYRAYVVNHEVGHFLHLGHKPCPGKGQPAPVMMQQSKGLGGCVANAWPATSP